MTTTSQPQTNLYFLTISQASELLRKRELSPVELTRSFLERIDSLDGELHAYITVLTRKVRAPSGPGVCRRAALPRWHSG